MSQCWLLQQIMFPVAVAEEYLLMAALHGAAPEKLRDCALQVIAVTMKGLGGQWCLERQEKVDGAASRTNVDRGSAVCLFLGVTATEFRLLVDEAVDARAVEFRAREVRIPPQQR